MDYVGKDHYHGQVIDLPKRAIADSRRTRHSGCVGGNRRKSKPRHGNDVPQKVVRGTFECVADYIATGIIGLMVVAKTLRLLGLVW